MIVPIIVKSVCFIAASSWAVSSELPEEANADEADFADVRKGNRTMVK